MNYLMFKYNHTEVNATILDLPNLANNFHACYAEQDSAQVFAVDMILRVSWMTDFYAFNGYQFQMIDRYWRSTRFGGIAAQRPNESARTIDLLWALEESQIAWSEIDWSYFKPEWFNKLGVHKCEDCEGYGGYAWGGDNHIECRHCEGMGWWKHEVETEG